MFDDEDDNMVRKLVERNWPASGERKRERERESQQQRETTFC